MNNEVKRIKRVYARHLIIVEKLYKMGKYTPMLRCVVEDEIELVIREVHEGACGSHISGRDLSRKIPRVDYYLPRML